MLLSPQAFYKTNCTHIKRAQATEGRPRIVEKRNGFGRLININKSMQKALYVLYGLVAGSQVHPLMLCEKSRQGVNVGTWP